MKRISNLFLALLTFVIGISLTSVWLLKAGSSLIKSEDSLDDCAITLAHKFTEPVNKADSLAELAGLYLKAGNKETSRKLLLEALKFAESIEDPLDKAGAIWRISDAGETEDLEKALTIARTIKDSKLYERLWAYRELAENFIRLERRDRAKAVLDEAMQYLCSLKYDDREGKELDLSFFGQLYAQAGFCPEALKASNGFKNKARIEEIKRETAICLAFNDQPDPAFRTAKTIEVYEDMKVDAFLGMTEIFAKTGQINLARRSLAAARKVDFTNTDGAGKTWNLLKIADAYRTVGDNKEFLKILEVAALSTNSITNLNFKIPAISGVAKSFAKAHSFERALELESTIDVPVLRSPVMLAYIATRMSETDEKTRAQEILERAVKMPNQNLYSLVAIADFYADNGFNQKSLDFLSQSENVFPFSRIDIHEAPYIEKILSIYFKLKKYDSAMEFALKIEHSRKKALAIAAVEIEIRNNNAVISSETRRSLSKLGCR